MSLKKLVLYCVAASIIGIVLIVSPLLALTMLRNESPAISHLISSERMRDLEGTYGSGAYSYSDVDVGIFALCFFIALAVYLLVKRKSRVYHPESIWFRPLY